MKSYRTLTLLFIKQQLLGRVFPLCAAIFLSLFTAFSLLCPEKQPISAQVGLSYDKSDNELQTAFQPLLIPMNCAFSTTPPMKPTRCGGI